MEAAEIEKLTPLERLRTMELLWDSLVRDAQPLESPAWHGDVLAERLERIQRGQATFLSLDEVKRRFGRVHQ